jgi:pyrimidine-nucleoside phosphorylase
MIEAKRDGKNLSREEIEFIVRAAATGEGMDREQLAAWLMTVVWRGLSIEETVDLTRAMAHSGTVLSLEGVPKPWIDKHSTGGVGDKTTLILLPILAAAGLSCVKMSGRGLGKTGGTIDKLESIPGFRTTLSIEEMKHQAVQIGIALGGQSKDLAPADGVLYALRDVTGTVPSIPLIASSVLSKKIAGGAEIIGIDLKCGSGAFMESYEDARKLGQTMLEVGTALGLRLSIEITDMDQPLGRMAGNLAEVQEAIQVLQGTESGRLTELCLTLASSMLELAGRDGNLAEQVLYDGSALKKFTIWLKTQGATADINQLVKMPLADHVEELLAPLPGWIESVNAGMVGEAVVDLGGGRRRKDQPIDPRVAVETLVTVGQQVEAGQPMFRIFASDQQSLTQAKASLDRAVTISNQMVNPTPLVLERMGE